MLHYLLYALTFAGGFALHALISEFKVKGDIAKTAAENAFYKRILN